MKYHIISPSYKRSKVATSHKYFNGLSYVVDESEADQYRAIHAEIIVLPDGVQGNLCRVLNWILGQYENVLIVDDDYGHIGRINFDVEQGKSWVKKLSPEQAEEFIEHGFNLAEEFGVHFWGINLSCDKGMSREYTPFSMSSYIGGPFRGHLKNECRYDERLSLKDDYDMTLQVLNRYRKALRFNNYFYKCDQHGKEGGCSTHRTVNRDLEQNEILRKKWGSKIVRKDSGNSKTHRKKKSLFDINPIIRVPIKGI